MRSRGYGVENERFEEPCLSFLFVAGMSNCRFFQCNLDYFRGAFDVGLSLHACGLATDLVLAKCLSAPSGPGRFRDSLFWIPQKMI